MNSDPPGLVLLDTSILIESLAGRRDAADLLRNTIQTGHRIEIPSLVLYEWLRGPRATAELAAQQALFPDESALPFGHQVAAIAARLYQKVSRPRGREIDLVVAAHALYMQAALWTGNPRDFKDIPGLSIFTPPQS